MGLASDIAYASWAAFVGVIMLTLLMEGERVRNMSRKQPVASYGDPEVDAAVQFARLIGVQSGYSWGAFYRDSVVKQEDQFVEAMAKLMEHRNACKNT